MEVNCHNGWHQRGVRRGKNKGKKMCVKGRRETKRITVLKYTDLLEYSSGTLSHKLKADNSDRTPLTLNLRILTTGNYTQNCLFEI